jgi:hypothetical protein
MRSFQMKKWLYIGISCLILFLVLKVSWDYIFPSQDIQKSLKNLKADRSGLDRIITHCVNDRDCLTWEGVTKIYPFPDSQNVNGGYSASGSSFSFTMNGKKILCGPGWRIIEK